MARSVLRSAGEEILDGPLELQRRQRRLSQPPEFGIWYARTVPPNSASSSGARISQGVLALHASARCPETQSARWWPGARLL